MQIWLIRDGEKLGPFSDFDVRRDIEDGLYQADTPAWHEGLENWITLGEMAVFRSEFERSASDPPPHRQYPPDTPQPSPPFPSTPQTPKSSAKLHLVRRFWARWIDIQIHITICLLFLYFANFDIGAMIASPWIILMLLVAWIPIEAVFIHFHGTTPGKWLLGIRLCNDDETMLSVRQSAWRAFRVIIAGLGLGLPYVMPLCLAISYWITRRVGRTLWDQIGGHSIHFRKIRIAHYLSVIGILFVASQFQFAILAPHLIPIYQEQIPALKEHFEKNPPRHFPERHKPPGR